MIRAYINAFCLQINANGLIFHTFTRDYADCGNGWFSHHENAMKAKSGELVGKTIYANQKKFLNSAWGELKDAGWRADQYSDTPQGVPQCLCLGGSGMSSLDPAWESTTTTGYPGEAGTRNSVPGGDCLQHPQNAGTEAEGGTPGGPVFLLSAPIFLCLECKSFFLKAWLAKKTLIPG